MKKFTIVVKKETYGYLTVEAPSAERALEWFERGEETVVEDDFVLETSDWEPSDEPVVEADDADEAKFVVGPREEREEQED